MRSGGQVLGLFSACPCALAAARLQDFRGQLLGEGIRKDAGEGNAEAQPVGGAGDRRHHFGDGLLSGGLRTVRAFIERRTKGLQLAAPRLRRGLWVGSACR